MNKEDLKVVRVLTQSWDGYCRWTLVGEWTDDVNTLAFGWNDGSVTWT